MLRPMVATAAVTAAVVLLAGCGGNDKTSDSSADGGGGKSAPSTPSTPSVPSFDPPKAFTATAAYPNTRDKAASSTLTTEVGIVGQTALAVTVNGITGRNITDGVANPWMVPSKTADTTTVTAQTKPMAVKLDGKDAVAVAYLEDDKGNGTQKTKGLVVFQWIDPADGKKLAEATADLSRLIGPGESGKAFGAQTWDAETGQIAVGVGAGSETASKKVGRRFAVFADPKTQKATMIPFVNPAGVLGGTVAGAKGSNEEGAGNGTVVQADGATGKVLKQFPTGQDYLTVIGTGPKRGYFSSSKYVKAKPGSYDGTYKNVLYSVDIATGAVVTTKSGAVNTDAANYNCWSDRANATVCVGGTQNDDDTEIIGFDDTSGKKTWGYTSKSANRIIPDITTAYHGVVYAQTEAQPVLLNATTGADIPTAGPTSSGTTPTDASTPSSGGTPSSGDTPSSGSTPSDGGTPGAGNAGSDMSLYNGKPASPDAVSPYGAVYKQAASGDQYDIESILIALKATA